MDHPKTTHKQLPKTLPSRRQRRYHRPRNHRRGPQSRSGSSSPTVSFPAHSYRNPRQHHRTKTPHSTPHQNIHNERRTPLTPRLIFAPGKKKPEMESAWMYYERIRPWHTRQMVETPPMQDVIENGKKMSARSNVGRNAEGVEEEDDGEEHGEDENGEGAKDERCGRCREGMGPFMECVVAFGYGTGGKERESGRQREREGKRSKRENDDEDNGEVYSEEKLEDDDEIAPGTRRRGGGPCACCLYDKVGFKCSLFVNRPRPKLDVKFDLDYDVPKSDSG
ncbi:hypothetical protein MKZ38_003387 [Zalerion maritima]|uniref:Uncharacterized protein n=1 Tax=Zalerion maritima TaxID=339359 RepID=A0AAD5RNH4_9PEZI|nr:hypothetical protein MKZ38_003387 [Zalerion maritima]